MNSHTVTVLPVILCGGSGSRLWPLSRASYPKQFWPLHGEKNETLLQQSYLRLQGLKGLTNPLLICNEDHRFIVAEQMRKIDISPKAIILEPIGKNTAPAIAIAALEATQKGDDPLMLVLAADHVIKNVQQFHKAIQAGHIYAEQGQLVTFGIKPTSPETGYGYIEASDGFESEELKGIAISKFIEKPDQETAKRFIADNRFSWNSGIFLFKASTIIKELEKLAPEILNFTQQAFQERVPDLEFLRLDKKIFKKCPNIAFDVAVMEKTNIGTVIQLDAGWNDIGSWSSIWSASVKDPDGNVVKGRVKVRDSKNCYLQGESRLIVSVGMENLVVVETEDALLIAKHTHSEQIKDIVKELELDGHPESKSHRKSYRPWGSFSRVVEGAGWQVKKLEVKPGESLSLQMHHQRSEHWVVVKGTALIEKNGRQQLIKENESAYIPIGCKHRLTNPGKTTIELIEVQTGSYLGEDDIIRFEDSYGRINKHSKPN